MRTAFVTILFVNAMYIHMRMHVHMHVRSYCHAAYRQFIWWTFRIRLGRRVRKIIPSCAVTAIRQAFPELDNIYVGYKEYAAL